MDVKKIKVKTTEIGGRYQHKVINLRGGEEISDVVVMLKKVNERLYEEMPVGSDGLLV